MKTFASLAASIFIAGAAHAAIVAGPIVNPANGHLYYLLSSDTWTNSEAEAVILGGHLVTINDPAENRWVVDMFAQYGGVARPLWIGLTDRESEGTFQWASGEPFVYANWNLATSEPNNSGGSGYEEDFAYIIQQNSGNPAVFPTFWNDVPNDGYGVGVPMYGIVEVVSSAPVPVIRDGHLCWPSVAGEAYQAQWKPARSRGAWVNLGPVVKGTGGEVCSSGRRQIRGNRVYRIHVLD